MASPAENMFRFLGGLGGGDNALMRAADAMRSPESRLREQELLMRQQERADEIAARKAWQSALGNPEVLGTLSKSTGLPVEILQNLQSPTELATLGRITSAPDGGATGVLVDRLMSENPEMSFGDALAQVQSGYRQGVQFQNGQAVPIQGYGQALGNIGGQKAYGTETGTLQAQMELKPQVEQATQQAQEVGKERGAAQAKLESMTANMPKLEKVVTDLGKLAQTATYTKTGQLVDAVRRETGLEPRESAVARAEFISKIDNETLPLLRETFGAAFTVEEGKRLRDTLGSPDLSPQEKMAALRSFIDAKTGEIAALQRREGVAVPQGGQAPQTQTAPQDRQARLIEEARRRGLIQ